jgi:hypothetical protein
MAYAFPGLVVLLLLELTRQEPFLSDMIWFNAIGQGAMNQRTLASGWNYQALGSMSGLTTYEIAGFVTLALLLALVLVLLFR